MNYFDDIVFKDVSRVISRHNGKPGTAHDFWGIGLMLGSGEVKAVSPAKSEICYKMPFLYLIRPNPSRSSAWGVVNGAERDNRWIIMQGPRAERMVSSLWDSPMSDLHHQIHLKSYHELIRLHDKLLHLFRSNIPSKTYRLAVCMEEFAGAISDSLAVTKQKSPVFRYAAQVADMIANEPGADYDIEDLARKHQISCDHFRRCFHEYAGKPIYEFLLEKRLALAENLLHNSSASIKEISERCGFARQAEFARFIKRRTSCTPSELRNLPGLDSE